MSGGREDAVPVRGVWTRTAALLRPSGLRLERPKATVEGMRWLYLVSAVAALLLTLPAPLTMPTPGGAGWTLLGAGLLIASWTTGYVLRRCSLWLDLVDAVGLVCVAVACPQPAVVLCFTFPGLWFRGLYGSMLQALVRCAVYGAGMVASVPLWSLVAGQGTSTSPAPVVGALPIMFIVVITGRLLAACLFSREEAAGRDAALASVGESLLSLTDPQRILEQAGATSRRICEATPGLRMLVLLPGPDGSLTTAGSAGSFARLPDALPREVVTATAGQDGAVVGTGLLDELVGRRCAWLALPLAGQPEGSWMVLGAPGRVPQEAVLAVRSLMNQVALAMRNSAVHHALTRQASTDGLTGLLNRTAFRDAVEQALAETRGEARGAVSLLFVDLDDFKPVNDELGHAAGDALLVEVAARLRHLAPVGSTCARLGGDEFAVLVHGLDREDSARLAEDLVRSLRRPVQLEGTAVRIGASVGVAATGGADGTPVPFSGAHLVRAADAAMYEAKNTGKNAVATAWRRGAPAAGAALGGW
ncbi:diguanylate cyclase domain-containing protein [Kineococcus gypseus]|uniref:diguanylate cyclase domain-containing protein n=1 Tax=Kineococcus gypseus TaxID=1637102 RepID=UPI003D7EB5DE